MLSRFKNGAEVEKKNYSNYCKSGRNVCIPRTRENLGKSWWITQTHRRPLFLSPWHRMGLKEHTHPQVVCVVWCPKWRYQYSCLASLAMAYSLTQLSGVSVPTNPVLTTNNRMGLFGNKHPVVPREGIGRRFGPHKWSRGPGIWVHRCSFYFVWTSGYTGYVSYLIAACSFSLWRWANWNMGFFFKWVPHPNTCNQWKCIGWSNIWDSTRLKHLFVIDWGKIQKQEIQVWWRVLVYFPRS